MNPVKLFESEFASYVGVDPENTVACSSGTAALITSILALNLPPNSNIITTPFTFPATANAIILAGHAPVFVDIDDSFQLDPAELEKIGFADAVLPVHLFGRSCRIDEICQWAHRRNIPVIEDCAQATGLRVNGRHVGTFGDAGTFSFYASKNLPAFEGGMVITSSEKIATRARQLINHGFNSEGVMVELGYNFKMPWINAFLGWQHLLLHKPGIEAELGRYSEKDGYYPKLVYQHDWYQEHGAWWAAYPCPRAEEAVARVRAEIT